MNESTDTPEKVWRRFYIFGFILLSVLWLLDRTAYRASLVEEKNAVILEVLESNKILSDELNVLFHGVQDDFIFFEKELYDLKQIDPTSLKYQGVVQSLVKFLETHSGYFMVRLTDSAGKELFKIVDSNSKFKQSFELIDLSKQSFYQELNSVRGENFYFSSVEPLIISGVVIKPYRPTVRIGKRITYNKGETGLLIFNIDGEKILNHFSRNQKSNNVLDDHSALIDAAGNYIVGFPPREKDFFISKKKSLEVESPEIFHKLYNRKDLQGSLDTKEGLLVYSRIDLPKTTENWFLITKISDSTWEEAVRHKRMTWIFWGLLCFVILMFWYWKHEKKRYHDEVVEVLLKERNEFIQNVSHQLKTPLAIVHNALNKREPSQSDWEDIKKENTHLIKVVDDLLLLALVDANPIIPLEQEDILDIVSDAIMKVGPKSKERNVSIRLNVDEKLYNSSEAVERPVMGELLKSAIMNVLDNAIDFSPREGVVDIFVTVYGNHVKIQIKDNGPGIPEDFLPMLFDRFARAKTIDRKGSGLGLPITKKVIELHGGDIKVTEYKKGTTFEITL